MLLDRRKILVLDDVQPMVCEASVGDVVKDHRETPIVLLEATQYSPGETILLYRAGMSEHTADKCIYKARLAPVRLAIDD